MQHLPPPHLASQRLTPCQIGPSSQLPEMPQEVDVPSSITNKAPPLDSLRAPMVVASPLSSLKPLRPALPLAVAAVMFPARALWQQLRKWGCTVLNLTTPGPEWTVMSTSWQCMTLSTLLSPLRKACTTPANLRLSSSPRQAWGRKGARASEKQRPQQQRQRQTQQKLQLLQQQPRQQRQR